MTRRLAIFLLRWRHAWIERRISRAALTSVQARVRQKRLELRAQQLRVKIRVKVNSA